MKQDIFETPTKDLKVKDLPAWQAYLLAVAMIAVVIGSGGTALLIILAGYVLHYLGKTVK